MSVSKAIEAQVALFRDLDKRFAEAARPQAVEQTLAAVSEAQEARIKNRIARLEADRKTALERYDAAIAVEQAALKEVLANRPSVPKPEPPRPTRPRSRTGAAAAKKGGTTRKKKSS
jgi:hypothetical protein